MAGWQDAPLFVYFPCFCTYIHSIIFIKHIHPSSFVESLSISSSLGLSRKDLPGLPSRKLNSGLPYCHRLNMKLDLQSLFGLLCTTVLIGRDHATPPAFVLIYEGAIGHPMIDDIRNPLVLTIQKGISL
jgi:hypothetical protein